MSNATGSYFETLAAALDEAMRRAMSDTAEFDAEELHRFLAYFCNGGVNYGDTKRSSIMLFRYRGKLNYTRALTIAIYRTENGRYELTSYIN